MIILTSYHLSFTFQQKETFSDACGTVISCDLFEGSRYFLVYVEASLVHEVVQALAVELPLDFGEDRLDRIEFGRVTDVPNGLDV